MPDTIRLTWDAGGSPASALEGQRSRILNLKS